MSQQPPNSPVRIHIDRLVVHGLQRREIAQLGPNLEKELQRLLSEQGVPAGINRSQQLRKLITGPLRLKQTQGPQQVAKQLAATLYQGLSHV